MPDEGSHIDYETPAAPDARRKGRWGLLFILIAVQIAIVLVVLQITGVIEFFKYLI